MANSGFELYVDPSKYQSEIGNLNSQLAKLQSLASEYASMKSKAAKAWGSEDENLAKATAICDSAIAVVNQKIEATKGSIEVLEQVLGTAQDTSAQMGSALDAGKSYVDSLLK